MCSNANQIHGSIIMQKYVPHSKYHQREIPYITQFIIVSIFMKVSNIPIMQMYSLVSIVVVYQLILQQCLIADNSAKRFLQGIDGHIGIESCIGFQIITFKFNLLRIKQVLEDRAWYFFGICFSIYALIFRAADYISYYTLYVAIVILYVFRHLIFILVLSYWDFRPELFIQLMLVVDAHSVFQGDQMSLCIKSLVKIYRIF